MAVDKKLKRYNVVPSTSDVYAVSLVDLPAVESTFVALAEQRKPMNFKIQSEERRMLYGVALRADFDIYRCYGDEEFYINFDKDAVRRLMTKFMKNFAQRNFSKDHMEFAEGLTVVESWIVENVENDKANVLGLTDFSEGSWMIGVKVDDDETWRSIKEGRWSGFSVEAFCDLAEITKEIKNNSHIKMAKKTKLDEILDNIKGIIADAITEGDGETPENVEQIAEETAEQVVEEVENKDENKEETVEAASDEQPSSEETPAEETEQKPEEVAEQAIETVEENAETDEQAAEDLQAVVDSLKAEIDTLKAENEELKKQNQKMSKQPSVKPNTKQSAGNQKFSAIDQLSQMGLIKW